MSQEINEAKIADAILKKIKENVKSVDDLRDIKLKEKYRDTVNLLQKTAKRLIESRVLNQTQAHIFPTFFGLGECGSMANLAYLMLVYSGKIPVERIGIIGFVCSTNTDKSHGFCHIGTIGDCKEQVPYDNEEKLKKYFVENLDGYIVDTYCGFTARATDLPKKFLDYFKENQLDSVLSITTGDGLNPETVLSAYNTVRELAEKSAYLYPSPFKPITLDIPDIKEEKAQSTSEKQKAMLNNQLGVAAHKKGNFKLAVEHFQKCADYWTTQPGSIQENQKAQFCLGAALVNLGKYQEALAPLQKAYDLQDSSHRKGTKYEERLNSCKEKIKATEQTLVSTSVFSLSSS